MPAGRSPGSLTVRYSIPHNLSMAGVSAGMIVVAVVHFATNPQNAPTLSLNDPRFALFTMLALAMAYYVYLGVSRARDRSAQVAVEHGGIRLGAHDVYLNVAGGLRIQEPAADLAAAAALALRRRFLVVELLHRRQLLVGAGRLHPVRHPAQQLDHFAARLKDGRVAAEFQIGDAQLFLAAHLVGDGGFQLARHRIIALGQPFEFTKDESFDFDREKAPWAKSGAELDELWRKRVKNDFLSLRLSGRKDEKIVETLRKRYEGLARQTAQFNSDELTLFHAVKAAFDPSGLANPFKVLPSPAACGDVQHVPDGAWI